MEKLVGLLAAIGAVVMIAAAARSGRADQRAGSGQGAGQKAAGSGAARNGALATATFAGGCFWCTQSDFDKVDGVVSTRVGYTGGHTVNPSYEQVSAGGTGHRESIEVRFDPSRVSYTQLLDYFWKNIDPTDAAGQFCDKGEQYRSAIFYHDATQQRLAEASKQALEKSHRFAAPIATDILPASTFYPAEDYHQDYYKKSALRYKFYRFSCGRDQRLEQLWGASAKH
jgi:methionine-S-sulfoxide reductase